MLDSLHVFSALFVYVFLCYEKFCKIRWKTFAGCRSITSLKRDTDTGVFLKILHSAEHHNYKTAVALLNDEAPGNIYLFKVNNSNTTKR